eukprot:TRINITY_DN11957_c0_g1_i1.p1 TRINITY_DN11957_c0_g1~~TRINITY_DN11957_c0_g1_i1.p1  ORF type:complete len:226 (-),score=36.69 TRINITY_DN11957_c0_g1_i1:44-721(-)
MPQMRLVFGFEERGLPSLRRGWRTPDPSPTRSGMLKCTAPQGFILADSAMADSAEHDQGIKAQRPKEFNNEELGCGQPEWSRIRTPSPPSPRKAVPVVIYQEDLGAEPKTGGSQKVMLDLVACLPCERPSLVVAGDSRRSSSASEGSASTPEWQSQGSFGHPYSCGGACKYFSKPKGCKDGANCDHCHICHWKKPAAILRELPPRRSRLPQGVDRRRGRKHAATA